MIIKGVPAKNIKKRLFNYLTDMGDIINLEEVLSIINRELPENSHIVPVKNKKETTKKILVCTGAGNTIKGGADIWVNNFLQNVWTKLKGRNKWKLLIDSKDHLILIHLLYPKD